MEYIFKAKSDSETIQLETGGNKKLIENIKITTDTVEENTNDRSSNILYRVELKGTINWDTRETCKKFMDWSLASNKKDIYREVSISIYEDINENPIRDFKIPNMFCEDYIENFNCEKENIYFELKLIQKTGCLNDIENFAD